jgi:hypothetical protein
MLNIWGVQSLWCLKLGLCGWLGRLVLCGLVFFLVGELAAWLDGGLGSSGVFCTGHVF